MRRRLAAVPAVVVASVSIAVACSVLAAPPAGAAGVTTHGWMAVEAIDLVVDAELRALLEANEHQVRAGAMFPDAGYLGSNTFGEEAHWQRFVDAYVALIRAEGCDTRAELLDATGPCPDLVAHVLGVAAHGMGDEVWDWLFEPNGPDLDEYYTDPAVPLFGEGGAELQMDVVAVGVHGVPRPVIPPLPDTDLLLQAFVDAGLAGVTADQFALTGLGELVWDLEAGWVPTHLPGIQAAMPWMSSNMIAAPGGVEFAAEAIAGYWRSIWARLQGDDPVTEVSITHPAPDQLDLPATGWVRSYQAGSSRTGGGARTRIVAVLTDSMPYRPPGGSAVSNQLPLGTLTITDEATGDPVPILPGYPRIVPYTADPGEHLVDVQPAVDLGPCNWFRVDVGVATPLIDARGDAVEPHSWSFRTACEADQVVGVVTGPSGEPVEGVWVLPYAEGDGWFPSTSYAVTGADGRFDLGVLPPGTYRIAFVAPGGSGLSSTWAGGSPSRAAAQPLVLDGSGPAESTVYAQLAGATTIEGRVTDASGQPVAGVPVRAFGPGDTWAPTGTATTAADGSFAFVGLPVAAYQVAVRPPGGGRLWWFPGTASRAAATPVDLATGTPAAVDVTLP